MQRFLATTDANIDYLESDLIAVLLDGKVARWFLRYDYTTYQTFKRDFKKRWGRTLDDAMDEIQQLRYRGGDPHDFIETLKQLSDDAEMDFTSRSDAYTLRMILIQAIDNVHLQFEMKKAASMTENFEDLIEQFINLAKLYHPFRNHTRFTQHPDSHNIYSRFNSRSTAADYYPDPDNEQWQDQRTTSCYQQRGSTTRTPDMHSSTHRHNPHSRIRTRQSADQTEIQEMMNLAEMMKAHLTQPHLSEEKQSGPASDNLPPVRVIIRQLNNMYDAYIQEGIPLDMEYIRMLQRHFTPPSPLPPKPAPNPAASHTQMICFPTAESMVDDQYHSSVMYTRGNIQSEYQRRATSTPTVPKIATPPADHSVETSSPPERPHAITDNMIHKTKTKMTMDQLMKTLATKSNVINKKANSERPHPYMSRASPMVPESTPSPPLPLTPALFHRELPEAYISDMEPVETIPTVWINPSYNETQGQDNPFPLEHAQDCPVNSDEEFASSIESDDWSSQYVDTDHSRVPEQSTLEEADIQPQHTPMFHIKSESPPQASVDYVYLHAPNFPTFMVASSRAPPDIISSLTFQLSEHSDQPDVLASNMKSPMEPLLISKITRDIAPTDYQIGERIAHVCYTQALLSSSDPIICMCTSDCARPDGENSLMLTYDKDNPLENKSQFTAEPDLDYSAPARIHV